MQQKDLIPYSKYHALGNDYIVLRRQDIEALSAFQVQRICDRHFGIGSDGILLDLQDSSSAPFAVQIFNPDGGEAEKSGNGLRIFSRVLWDAKRVRSEPFHVDTLGGKVQARVSEDGSTVAVEMGAVSFARSSIPMSGSEGEVLEEPLRLENGETVSISAANIGNPHCIVLSDAPSKALACRLGPLIEAHRSFPQRTNVQFVKLVSRALIQMEIWERGAGYTLASGSSASATAAVLHRLGLCDKEVQVEMPGGSLEIRIGSDYQVHMKGAVTRVASGILYAEALEYATPLEIHKEFKPHTSIEALTAQDSTIAAQPAQQQKIS